MEEDYQETPRRFPGLPGDIQETSRRHQGDIQETRRHPGDTRRHPGDTQETPGATQETPRRHPGETQEAPRGTQRHPEAPRRHPGGSEAENLKNVDFCMLFTAYLTNGRKSAWYTQQI